MRFLYICFILCMAFVSVAQDKIYMLNGDKKTGFIREVGTEEILYIFEGEMQRVDKNGVMMLVFSNGLVDIINRPSESTLFMPEGVMNTRHEKNKKTLSPENMASLNTLAFCNSDLSFFYERFFSEKQFGFGAMGAYNFNNYAGLSNAHIFVLSGGKKNYDLGMFGNYYTGENPAEKSFYIGFLVKYTNLSFYRTVLSGTQPNITISYIPANGSQTSTIFTCGTHRALGKNMFIRTIYGLGGFNLKGEYKTEFNYQNSRSGGPANQNSNRNFLFKFYFGINAGFLF